MGIFLNVAISNKNRCLLIGEIITSVQMLIILCRVNNETQQAQVLTLFSFNFLRLTGFLTQTELTRICFENPFFPSHYFDAFPPFDD